MTENKVVTKGSNTFKLHRSADQSDPGFTIVGKRLYWVHSYQNENDPGRPWAVLRKDDMPKELVDHLERKNPALFRNGQTIARGDLVLAYCSMEVYEEMRREQKQIADDQFSRVKTTPGQAKDTNKDFVKVFQSNIEHGTADAFRVQR